MKIVNVLILFDLYRESINFVQTRWKRSNDKAVVSITIRV